MFWVALSIRGGGIDSPRPASQRAAALVLTAALLTGAAFPAFAGTYYIEEGNITISAGTQAGTNKVEQVGKDTVDNDKDTIITNQKTDTASSHTVTIDAGNDKVEVTLDNVNIKADSGSALTSKGDVTLTLKGDNSLTGGNGSDGHYGSYGISSSGSLGGSSIGNSGSLTITGGEKDSLTAQGGYGSLGGGGISINGAVTISGGTVNAASGKGGGGGAGSYGSGITSKSLTVSGGTVNAAGSNGGRLGGQGGYGIDSGDVTISGGSTVNATGGEGGPYDNGGYGIHSSGIVTIYGGTVTANGGNSGNNGNYRSGGEGIYGSKGVTISGGTVTANGGNGSSNNGYGGEGIDSGNGSVAISGGTVNTAGGNGSTGGSSIRGKDIDLSGSLELTAKAGKGTQSNGKVLSQNGNELDLNDIKDKLDPGADITTKDADSKVIQHVSIPRPVEPEEPVIPGESSSSSDGGSATPSAPVSSLPGLTVTDKSGAVISYTSTQSGNTLTVCVGRFTASLHASLSALRQLRAEGIDTITFQTILCSTTLSVDELLAMGGEDTPVALAHSMGTARLTVGGEDHSELLK